ncbi:hypothetical protein [Candidatus Bandiella euplotis]|uniref:IS6 family transposase n=1 Tax=Candidatus Bandiella euplotis TaxID=1664265 RepID=A0ABZ0UNP7_9RICK|nr:hypothetical protein [Candidatus Bandiella woodruffii]WPX97157.1 IS6 family transposase [Candidatus Bandiella woodruffii]
MFKVDPKLMKYFKNHEYGAEIIMVSLYMKGRYGSVASVKIQCKK